MRDGDERVSTFEPSSRNTFVLTFSEDRYLDVGMVDDGSETHSVPLGRVAHVPLDVHLKRFAGYRESFIILEVLVPTATITDSG